MTRPSRKPDLLGSVLELALGRRRLASVLAEATIESRWEEAVGPQVAARARPDGLRNGVLTVRVASAPWMTELSFLKPALLARINAAAGATAEAPIVTDLRLAPGRLPPPPVRPAAPLVLPPLSAEQGRLIDDITREVDDPLLRAAISRILERALAREALARQGAASAAGMPAAGVRAAGTSPGDTPGVPPQAPPAARRRRPPCGQP